MRTAITLFLGVWLAGMLLLGGVASENFFMIDHLLQSPSSAPFQKEVAALPPGEARVMLRHLAAELNRFYFNIWGWTELGLGALILGLAIRALRQTKFIAGFSIMLTLAAVMTLYMTPRIIVVGRSLDFVPRNPPPPGMSEFGMLHAAYSILELIKLLIGIGMAVALVRLPSRNH